MTSRTSHGQSRRGRTLLKCVICALGIAWTPAFNVTEGKRRSMVVSFFSLLPSSAMAAMDPKQQVTAAMQKLEDLCDPEYYKKVASGGGDNIRREVGTVGVTSPLFDVDKAFKALAEEAEDPEAYVELLERFTKGITRADADAYSSIFSMNSAAATSPQVYIDKAFEELKVAKAAARELTNMLKL
mmetsp:Transcript_38129/g.82098  ORF Transcript_38129/g.82098 Transcript_38129/m.82098 type:complete len:185 (+) Transcript_38129:20-574(+)